MEKDETAGIPGLAQIQWRSESVETLLPRIEPLLPRMNATMPFDISLADVLGIPVYMTVRPADLQAMPFDRMKEWGEMDFFHTHQGKGVTGKQSRVSCIMETIERCSAGYERFMDQTTVAAYETLGREALDPAAFFIPPEVVYEPENPLTWYEGTDLFQNEYVRVPIDFAFINFPDSAYPFEGFQNRRLGFFVSNGLSAGTSLTEALAGGLCEVLERDAQWRVLKGLDPRPTELILDKDPDFGPWLEWFGKHNLGLRAFYLNHKPGFFTAFAACWDPYGRLLTLGSACAPEIRFALQQAILEVTQQRAFLFFRKWKTHGKYFPIVRYIKERIPPDQYHDTVPSSFWTENCRAPIPINQAGEDAPWDLDRLVAGLSDQHRVVGLDLTDPALGIPVVRVLVSGLLNGYFDYRQALWFINEK